MMRERFESLLLPPPPFIQIAFVMQGISCGNNFMQETVDFKKMGKKVK